MPDMILPGPFFLWERGWGKGSPAKAPLSAKATTFYLYRPISYTKMAYFNKKRVVLCTIYIKILRTTQAVHHQILSAVFALIFTLAKD